jgi:predicted PurR-regulated permease PerM
MIGAGTFINPLIKIVTAVAILGATYLFIVKPALDTTKEVSESFSAPLQESAETINGLQPSIQRSFEKARRTQDQAAKASNAQLQQAEKLLGCITDAAGDVDRIQACNKRFSP